MAKKRVFRGRLDPKTGRRTMRCRTKRGRFTRCRKGQR